MGYCPKCGSQVREEDNFCSHCGLPLKNFSETGYPKKATIGPHPTWSTVVGVYSLTIGFVFMFLIIYMSAAMHGPPAFVFVAMLISIIAIVVGIVYLIFGVREKLFQSSVLRSNNNIGNLNGD